MPALRSPEFTSVSTPEVAAGFLLSFGTDLLDLDALVVTSVYVDRRVNVKTGGFWCSSYSMEALQEVLHLLGADLLIFQEQYTSRRDCSISQGA